MAGDLTPFILDKKKMPALSVGEIRERLTKAGIQASAPRIAIAQYVWQTCDHPTADQIKAYVEKTFPQVSIATVYNTLKLFVSNGLLREVGDGESESMRYDCNMEPHFHLYDEASGEMIDIDPKAVGFDGPFHQINRKLNKDFDISEIQVTIRAKRKKL